jgi:hypothetical protein
VAPAATTGTEASGTATTTTGAAGTPSASGSTVTPTVAVPNTWQLKGDFPAKLVRSANKDGTVVKGLESTYLALPRRATLPPATVIVF